MNAQEIDTDVIDEQIQHLEDPDPRIRIRAAGQLGRIGNPRATLPLSETLKSEKDGAIRARIVGALGQIGGNEAVPHLSDALADPFPEVRKRAAEALNRISEPAALESLIQALTDKDRDVRRWAARALGKIGGDKALEALKRLRSDPDQVVQEEVILAIDSIENRQKLSTIQKQVDELLEERDRNGVRDSLQKVQINGQIDVQQFELMTLQASVAASEIDLPEEDRAQKNGSQALVNRLERLFREVESLSTSLNEQPYLKRAWDQQVQSIQPVLEMWKNGLEKREIKEMEKELRQLIANKEELIALQKKEKIKCNSNFEQAFSTILEIEQLYDLLSDPLYRTKVDTWLAEARATYRQMDQEKHVGNYSAVREYFTKITQLRDSTENVQTKDARQKRLAGYGVIAFVLIAVSILVLVLVRMGLYPPEDDTIAYLNVPYTVIIWSALGSLTAMLFQFINRPVSQLDTIKWLFARPIQGIIMGSFLYLAVAGGFILLANPANGTPSGEGLTVGNALRMEVAAVIAFLGGFSDKFAEEMVRRATSILTQSERAKEEREE